MKNLYQALLKAQQEFGPVLKNATNPAYKSKYADLSGVVETITETLHNNGLLVLQPTAVIDGENVVRTMVIHAESGECLESTYKVVTKDATDPQKVGAGLTYARRYALMAFFGLAPEDDDGNLASGRDKAEAADAPRPTPKPAATPADEPEVGPDQYYNPYNHQIYNPEPCSVCGKEVKASYVSYSNYKYGQTLCYEHQKQFDAEGR